ncbi:MAG: tRNA (adenosine(37)-N6)-threonylcarbamoyltransferase complex transferase subunit TsaD [Oscillospiraceae bacterium]|nr:tRNA (adenosine(37)-N6)-threonylcarbamoyltransferase complex transferase subunit TsaD [Oscillospiraceae bacterium]MBP1552660.1 tRNA (adenosine(37)-N6)-threonylcarbamoyltransferase complex transferase subunit TsaD [Oscillospiraceae bacterium]MBP1570278.1 tRNA (adenosine(37)-N6)-threonylcarbamoyltransferase complex transferase subunit TsaD [Oscillospiraceae bacterium]MBQ5313333.1 tRNA (adenosine(37)-N6)-threonylcarbamoyltransferase complex transferase subunit TsaD [Oscillospiraceae bacterium]M
MLVLGIESSCDETAASIVKDGREIISSVVYSQAEEHGLYGGVVPEIASRRHIDAISEVVQKCFDEANCTVNDVDAIACTFAPGLIGALLVGVNFAKGLSYASGKPLVPTHHIRGHIGALYLTNKDLKPPFICLVASGGHSHIVAVEDYTKFRVIGRTIDDAAGEAFDKVSRTLGLGYPGGPAVSKAALSGDKFKYKLPTPHTENKYDVSFSGLKTAVINTFNTNNMKGEPTDINSLAASFEEKISQILSDNLVNAAEEFGFDTLAIAGGVAANRRLRELIEQKAKGKRFVSPELSLCGDNAAMIAAQGYFEYLDGNIGDISLNGIANLDIDYR